MHHGVGEEHPDQPVDVLVERGREQQPLAARLDLLEQRDDLRHEAHVGHLVGLVEDGDRDLAERAVAALDEVLEPPGGGHEDLDAAAQRAGLAADRHPADGGGHAQVHGGGVRRQGVVDLLGEFAGGDEDEREGLPRLGAAAGRAGQEGEPEGERLAGAGAPASEDVAPGEGVGQGGALDREGLGDALRREGLRQGGGHVQRVEGLDGGQRRGDGLGERELLRGCHLAGGAAARAPAAGASGVPGGTAGLSGACVRRPLTDGTFGSSHAGSGFPSWAPRTAHTALTTCMSCHSASRDPRPKARDPALEKRVAN